MLQTARGTRDLMPKEAIRLNHVVDKIKRGYEKWGFDPIVTPAFEEWSLLAAKKGGGEDIKEEIYYFKDKSDRELGLRFDLTVPLARVVASNPNLPKPFRRYCIDKVWRYDRPGANRYREFYQADADIVGSESIESEIVCIAAVCDILKSLGFVDFTVRLNNRKLVERFVKSIGINNVEEVFRSIDKFEKIGEQGVEKELASKGIDESKTKQIIKFVKEDARDQTTMQESYKELEMIILGLKQFGFDKHVQIDLSLVRGLSYYTGPVFEINLGADVSCGGGGRYDDLVEVLGGKKTPSVGISIGVDRVINVMEERKMFSDKDTPTDLYIAPISIECLEKTKELAFKLINANVSVEYDVMNRSISKQLDYANAKKIPYVIVLGEKEIKEKRAMLKDMITGEQTEISLDNIKDIKSKIR